MEKNSDQIVSENHQDHSSHLHVTPPWAAKNPLNPKELTSRRIPPNSKCPCGSGKKFKKCCQYKDLETSS